MKKLLSLVLVLAVVLSSMSFAFAAVSDDVTDKAQKIAVDRLSALGLVAGMEDGKFHPEEKLTREQAAKLIVVALGLDSAADAAKGNSQFTDVSADRWSAGYINVAAGQGIVKGVGYGQFAPEAEVTYAQVVTMLVRGIGYSDEFLPGVWPNNYVAKAADVGIDDDVKFTPDQIATRGAMAVMVNNTLDADMVKITSYENGKPIWSVQSGVNLLSEKLDLEKEEDIRVIANNRMNDSLGDDDVTLRFYKNTTVDGQAYGINGGLVATGNFEVDSKVNTEAFLGFKVKAYFDGDKIVYIEKVKETEVAMDYIMDVERDQAATTNYDRLKLKVKDSYYDIASGADIYMNGSTLSIAANADVAPNSIGRFVIDNNRIIWAEIFDVTGIASGDQYNAFVVQSVNATDKTIKGIDGVADEDTEIDLADDYDSYKIISAKTGAPLTIEDIKANNVLYVTEYDIDGDDVATVLVLQDNVVTGNLDRVEDGKVRVAGTNYDLVKYDSATNGTADEIDTAAYDSSYSYNNFEDVDAYAVDDGNLEDMSGASVTLVKDIAGTARFINGDVNTNSGEMYGVILKLYDEGGKVKVYTTLADGSSDDVTYTFDDDSDLDGNGRTTADFHVGNIVKFKLNKDGEIAKETFKGIEALDGGLQYSTLPVAQINTTGNKLGKTSISVNNATSGTDSVTYKVTSSTKLYDLAGLTDADLYIASAADVTDGDFDVDNFSALAWDDIKEKAPASSLVVIADAKNEAKAVFFFDTGASGSGLASDTMAAYIVNQYKSGDKVMVTVKAFGEDVKDYEVDGDWGDFTDERPAAVKISGNGKLALAANGQTFNAAGNGLQATADGFTTVTGSVYAKDGDNLQILAPNSTLTWYKRTADTALYKEDGTKSWTSVSVGDNVYMVVEEGSFIRVIEKEAF